MIAYKSKNLIYTIYKFSALMCCSCQCSIWIS